MQAGQRFVFADIQIGQTISRAVQRFQRQTFSGVQTGQAVFIADQFGQCLRFFQIQPCNPVFAAVDFFQSPGTAKVLIVLKEQFKYVSAAFCEVSSFVRRL